MTEVKRPVKAALKFFAPVILIAVVANLATAEISMEHHSWGRFSPGSWRVARVTTETLDEDGSVINTTVVDEHVELLSISRNAVSLRVESTVDVAGKKFESPIKTVSLGLHGEVTDKQVDTRLIGKTNATIDGRSIPCHVHQYKIQEADQEKSVRLLYSPDVEPYVIRRETVVKDGNQQTKRLAEVQTIALEKPHKVFDEMVNTSHVKTVIRNGQSIKTIFAVHAPNVPGEVVSYNAKETDADGRVIRRSTMELVDYGHKVPESVDSFRTRRLKRRHFRRSRR